MAPGILCHLFWEVFRLDMEQLFYMVNISIKYFVALPVAILVYLSDQSQREFAASLNSIGISLQSRLFRGHRPALHPDIQRLLTASASTAGERCGTWKKEHFSQDRKPRQHPAATDPISLNRIDNTISNAMELRGFGNIKKNWYTKRSFARNDDAGTRSCAAGREPDG